MDRIAANEDSIEPSVGSSAGVVTAVKPHIASPSAATLVDTALLTKREIVEQVLEINSMNREEATRSVTQAQMRGQHPIVTTDIPCWD